MSKLAGFITAEDGKYHRLEDGLHSVRAELRSDVTVLPKAQARTDELALIRTRLDNAALLLRTLFAAYDKAQKDLAGVGVEAKCVMDGPMTAAYGAWLSENGGRAEGPGEAPIPVIHEDNS